MVHYRAARQHLRSFTTCISAAMRWEALGLLAATAVEEAGLINEHDLGI
jgi:hypothetical protein